MTIPKLPMGRTPEWLAGLWAAENGLTKPFTFSKPEVIVSGFAIDVTDGKGRAARCAFKHDGSRDVYDRLDRVNG